jgi:glycyl-tRNA synthetase
VRITRPLGERYTLRNVDLKLVEEQSLLAAYEWEAAVKDGSVGTLVASVRRLQPSITQLFDNVLIMDEDAAARENRLALLQAVAGLADGVADLSVLEGF